MITGVETAGLVLAAFPLVLKGLKSWTEGAEIVRRSRKRRQELKRYSIRLRCQQILCRNTLERLLDDIVPSSGDLAIMLNDPVGTLWLRPEFEQALELRLGDSYDLFCTVLSELKDAIDAIMMSLHIDSSGRVLDDEVSFLTRGFQGLKMALSKDAIEEQLDSLDRHCNFLQNNTEQNMDLEDSRRQREGKQIHSALKLIRQHAHKLYDALIRHDHWRCNCKAGHKTSLMLQHRSFDRKSPRFTLRIMLSANTSGLGADDTPGEQYSWEDVDVEITEIPSGEVENIQHLADAQDNKRSSHSQGQKKKISFMEPNSQKNPQNTDIDTPIFAQHMASGICAGIREALSSTDTTGFTIEIGSIDDVRLKCAFTIPKANGSRKICCRSLPTLFTSHRNCHMDVSQGDRLALAVHLASSVLQLESTPWLKKSWRTDSIDIFEHSHGGSCDKSVHQTIYSSFSLVEHQTKSSLIASNDTSLNTSMRKHYFRNESLVSLGCALVELSLGETLESLRLEEDADDSEVRVRFNTAQRMLDKVSVTSGREYADVAHRCLNCLFNMRDLSFENEFFQQAVFDMVVKPLERDLSWWRDWTGVGSLAHST